MNFFIFLILTAFAVSIDSTVAGFAIGLKTKKVWLFSFIVAVATLLLCFFTTCIAIIAKDEFGTALKTIGSLFLVAVGMINFFKKRQDLPKTLTFCEGLSLGFAVGTDACIANLSICLLGHTELWIPFVFAFTHFATVAIGAKLANSKLTKTLKHPSKISGIMLVCLGVFKLFA
ncbi:MAG: manganese efflux pump [Clostridia bacterium]|nr:manganese efflux pump [Clostridia bacterium]